MDLLCNVDKSPLRKYEHFPDSSGKLTSHGGICKPLMWSYALGGSGIHRRLVAAGVGIVAGCVLTYLASLIGYSPPNVGGYRQWGIPFQWHSIATGNGGLTLGPYRYVLLFNFGLDLVFWCALAAIAAYVLLSISAKRRKSAELNMRTMQSPSPQVKVGEA
jgi:hypothetical protein